MQRIVLDVGVGTNISYPFRPKITVDCIPLFMDIEEPEASLRKWDWVVGDAHYLPFRDRCLDGIVASHIIEHLVNPSFFMKECWRVLRKGGFLDLYLPNFLSMNARRDPSHKHTFNAFHLKAMLKRQGFAPSFDYTIASLMPGPIRKLLTFLINMLTDDIRLKGVKL